MSACFNKSCNQTNPMKTNSSVKIFKLSTLGSLAITIVFLAMPDSARCGTIFVANSGDNTIGEYTTSGATVNPALVSGLNGPRFLAVSGGNLFVTNGTTGTIGDYNATTG